MKNYVWIIVLIVWTLGMLIAAFFGMKEDLKNKKNDSPENRKPVRNLFIAGLISLILGDCMLFFTKLVPNLSKLALGFITEGIILLITSWSQQYKGKTTDDENHKKGLKT